MPHLTIEYTKGVQGVNTSAALRELNEVLVASGHFEESHIKSRAVLIEDFAIGTALEPRGFVHAKLAILSGRTPEVKEALSSSVLQALQKICRSQGPHVQLCVEIMDIDRASYSKAEHRP
ncbi:5-carboxymethyl-2-hydroxymuconate Delta-isomerase [Thauera sp. Sel9]|uniref:5-carboxymethyl-2-hydroxymuconate Delta-isomerase n=1 Tax=Thauera sp. Sel9 TaxID=2974299 RepID=UPI0021E14D5A|nr:5-carboxymethyl-2-hydroxymuconate Delta-isomerase [Thauera sp. Sel9]MCV2219044.1 5-carboxymethyl-2-hydroxymuconate Delta-isomerase [Thauera sp. Sel9]